MGNRYNYYEINSYCKSEGLDTDYFIYQLNEKKENKVRKYLSMVISVFAK